MKIMPVLAGVLLPLVAGFVHPEVQAALSNGKWGSVIGFTLGFNWLFMLFAGGLALFFALKSRPRSAWIAVGVVTAAGGIFSASTEFIDGRIAAITAKNDSKKIIAWNAANARHVSVKLDTCLITDVTVQRYGSGGMYKMTAIGLQFTGSITNKSSEKISAVVIDFFCMNKGQQQSVVTRKLRLETEVFPTATASVSQVFVASEYFGDLVMDEIKRAATQLNADYGWSYRVVAVIPESLKYLSADKELKPDAELSPAR